MIAVIFEVEPADGRREAYLDLAAGLRPRLEKIDGFISIERFQSLSDPGRVLSLSFWRDEEAVSAWRNAQEHRAAQAAGRRHVFADYRLRVAHVVRDYGMHERDQAPEDRGRSMMTGRREPYALPISMPAAKTSAPPSTTWKVARLQGVSM